MEHCVFSAGARSSELVSARFGPGRANAAHLAACWNAVEDAGGDPALVGEMRETLVRLCESGEAAHAWHRDGSITPGIPFPFDALEAAVDAARALLSRAKVTP